MNQPSENNWRPDLLAGYVDGELGPHDRKSVEAYLAAHSEVKADLEAQQAFARKSQIWQQMAVPQPSEAAWNNVSANISAALQPAAGPTLNYIAADDDVRVPRWRRVAAGLSVIAAVLILALGIKLSGPQLGGGTADDAAISDVFGIAKAGDIEIISLQGEDNMLLVGQSPLSSPVELVTAGDVVVHAIDSGLIDKQANEKDKIDPRKPIMITPTDKIQPVP